MIYRYDKIEHADKIAIVSIIIPFEEFGKAKMNWKTMTIKAKEHLEKEIKRWNEPKDPKVVYGVEAMEKVKAIYGDKIDINPPKPTVKLWDTELGPEAQHDVEEMYVSFFGDKALEAWKKEGGHTATELMRKIYKQEEKNNEYTQVDYKNYLYYCDKCDEMVAVRKCKDCHSDCAHCKKCSKIINIGPVIETILKNPKRKRKDA